MPPGHPIIQLKSNKFNMAAVSVKRSIEVGPVLRKNFARSKYRTLTCDLYRLTVSGGTPSVACVQTSSLPQKRRGDICPQAIPEYRLRCSGRYNEKLRCKTTAKNRVRSILPSTLDQNRSRSVKIYKKCKLYSKRL